MQDLAQCNTTAGNIINVNISSLRELEDKYRAGDSVSFPGQPNAVTVPSANTFKWKWSPRGIITTLGDKKPEDLTKLWAQAAAGRESRSKRKKPASAQVPSPYKAH